MPSFPFVKAWNNFLLQTIGSLSFSCSVRFKVMFSLAIKEGGLQQCTNFIELLFISISIYSICECIFPHSNVFCLKFILICNSFPHKILYFNMCMCVKQHMKFEICFFDENKMSSKRENDRKYLFPHMNAK